MSNKHENDQRDGHTVIGSSPGGANGWTGLVAAYRAPVMVAAHAVLLAAALLAAFLLAYNFRFALRIGDDYYTWFHELYLPLLILALPTKLLVFHWTGMYRGSWRYVGLRDLFDVIRASLLGTSFFLVGYFLLELGFHYFSGEVLIDRGTSRMRQSAVFVLDWAATVAFVASARILIRFYFEDIQRRRGGKTVRVLIVGAGDAGEAVLRELLRMRGDRYLCVGFLDDDAPHLKARIHGVEILGRTESIREVCAAQNVQQVFIALPAAAPRVIRSLVERCQGTGVLFRTIPAVTDLIEGRVQVKEMRDVDITDLLGRAPVKLDTDRIAEQLRGRCVMVTGAGGSIGSELCRQIAGFAPRRLILVERAENNLFAVHRELIAAHPNLDVVPLVADVCDRARIQSIFAEQPPAIVYHAAAHKHVPMMERNAGEAVKNNVGGTLTIADAAMKWGAETMVLISTDKAVNPTSMMGCTKRVSESYVQSIGRDGATQFVTVRFGNVLGSSGSVVPIFREQIAAGGPVTVTHPDMQRYFMTIPEAAQLVLQAGAMGRGGEIYVLHMGDPVKIVDLARDMITLSGLRPDVDIDITFTGIRPGEKLFEELANEHELIGDTPHPKIGIWKQRPGDATAIADGVSRLLAMADDATDEVLRRELKRLVPEYDPTPISSSASSNGSSPSPAGDEVSAADEPNEGPGDAAARDEPTHVPQP